MDQFSGSRPPTLGGGGMLYIDDIRLYQPRCFPDLAKPAADLNSNCVVDYPDLQILAGEWLSSVFLVAPQEPTTASLVAYYAFENDTQDGSGNGHHGTAQGAAVYAPGPAGYGMALEFNGAGDLVDLGTFDVVGPGITLSVWISPDDFDVADARIISKAISSSGNDHFWMVSTISAGGETRLRFRLKTDDGQGTATLVAGAGGLTAGEWAHVAARWDGSTMRLYKSGEEVGSMGKGGSAVAADPTVSAAIGNQPANATGGTRDYDGLIDEARIYGRALSEAEILWLAGTTETISEPFDLNIDGVVDLKDYAILAGTWLQQQLWP